VSTPGPGPRPPATRTELAISLLLRAGVVTSVLLVGAGTLLSFVHHPDYTSSPAALARLTRPGQAFESVRDVAGGVRLWHGQAVVMVGLLVLIATPILRVAFSCLIFLKERDRAFVAVTVTVLALLLLSFALGRAGG
jgi:uncharacterized membrane protein